MADVAKFHYRDLNALLDECAQLGVDLPTCDDVSVLTRPARFGRLAVPNRFVAQPMEGCDATPEGAPSELTIRKYERFAAGGSGMIWLEACAVVHEGRANPRQIWLHARTLPAFAEMVRRTRAAAANAGLPNPVLILQLTHSGRYSRPGKKPSPIIAHHSKVLDPRHKLPTDYPLITDAELDRLQDAYVQTARLAAQAGFDGVDIKSCHRYLLSELLAGFTRNSSRYGGEFENRTRMLRETMAKVRDAVGDTLEVSCRMNIYDAIEYPYGWGVDRNELKPDLAEPFKLVEQLAAQGLAGLNATIGNPYFNPHVNRPADWMIANWPAKPEHPLLGVGRMLGITRQLQQRFPNVAIVGSGFSWVRHFLPPIAAGVVTQGWASFIGVGRGALAYPDFARDIVRTGRMDRLKVCVTCSSCTQIMRDGGRSGCVIRDADVYSPIFKQGRQRDPEELKKLASLCRQCNDPNCAAHCPAGIDIPAFLACVAEGRFKDSYAVLRASNTLPEICGAVCPVEVQCQGHCIGKCMSDQCVPIADIQRWVSRMAIDQGWATVQPPAQTTDRSIAIVGAGPAGLAAAARLLELGHHVTLIERTGRPGGKPLTVIPTARLPREEAELEIQALFDGISGNRLEWRLNTALGPDHDLTDLQSEGFHAVLLAFGLGNATGVSQIAGRPERVLEANAFLSQMNNHPEHRVTGKIAVIGGGNTAIDAATVAAARGATDVYLLYRRTYSQMPAWPRERDQALHAGVHLMPFVQPVDYVSDGAGRATGLKLRRTELGPPGNDGRRSPVEVPGSDYVMDFDLIIEAMGEQSPAGISAVLGGVQLDRSGRITVDDKLMTAAPGVFAAGDIVNGGTTVAQAIAEGRRAADRMHEFVMSQKTV